MNTTRARRAKIIPNRWRFGIGCWFTALILSLSGVPFAHAAVSAEQRCQQAKLIASGKMSLCLKQQLSRKVAGKSSHPALCAAKFSAAITKADLRAARSGNSCRWLVNEGGAEIDHNASPEENASNTIIIFDGAGGGTPTISAPVIDEHAFHEGNQNQTATRLDANAETA